MSNATSLSQWNGLQRFNELTKRFYQSIPNLSDSDFNQFALDLYAFQREYNLPYNRYCNALKIGCSLLHWKDIPAVPQQAFKQFDLRVFPSEQTLKSFRTSGTTSESFGQHHYCDLGPYEASIIEGWRYFSLPETLPQMVLTPSPKAMPSSHLFHMMGILEKLDQSTLSPRYLVSAEGKLEIDEFLRQVGEYQQKNQPVFVLGTALSFLNLFEELEKRKSAINPKTIWLPQGSQAMETGGYKGSGRELTKEALYQKFYQFLDIPSESIINEYGMTELSSPFYTRGIGAVHQSVPWTRAVVINPKNNQEVEVGQTGILKLIDLANIGSILAIQTQDLAIRQNDLSNGTSAFTLLGRDPSALPRGCSRAADEMISKHIQR